jgi:hypothetical protein
MINPGKAYCIYGSFKATNVPQNIKRAVEIHLISKYFIMYYTSGVN